MNEYLWIKSQGSNIPKAEITEDIRRNRNTLIDFNTQYKTGQVNKKSRYTRTKQHKVNFWIYIEYYFLIIGTIFSSIHETFIWICKNLIMY